MVIALLTLAVRAYVELTHTTSILMLTAKLLFITHQLVITAVYVSLGGDHREMQIGYENSQIETLLWESVELLNKQGISVVWMINLICAIGSPTLNAQINFINYKKAGVHGEPMLKLVAVADKMILKLRFLSKIINSLIPKVKKY